MSNAISIRHLEIKMNKDGMYCLNDLHKGSGGSEKHKPSNWLATSKANSLILTLGKSAIKKSAGRYGGTYGIKEVVIAYAEWIGPKIYRAICQNFGVEGLSISCVRNEFSFGCDIVQNLFNGYEVIEQYEVLGGKYFIDWYVPELRLAIEFDESHHSSDVIKDKDKKRQEEIEKELGCKFLRYKEV